MMRGLIITFFMLFIGAGAALAVQPDEVLSDPALETRAREISKDLRCLVCRNESIDESNAELARDLRILVRERLVAGDSNAQALDFIVNRFGEYVLLRPQTDGANQILWWAGPLLLLMGLIIGGAYLRGRSKDGAVPADTLSPDEETRLKNILQD